MDTNSCLIVRWNGHEKGDILMDGEHGSKFLDPKSYDDIQIHITPLGKSVKKKYNYSSHVFLSLDTYVGGSFPTSITR